MNETVDMPFVSAEVSLPEITVKSLILAIVITAVLGAANAYLALKMGQTISASIPAAIIAMGALRFFRRHNILENNIIQTAASAGEGVACAVAFVLPALLMTGYWHYFHYWETMLITLIGGFFGVLFSVPLRKVMLNYPSLNFPEGTAVGNVLKASGAGTAKMKYLLNGGLGGGLIVLLQNGLQILSDKVLLWGESSKILFGMSIGFSPALVAAGFIVGFQACVALLVGIVVGWVIGVPVYSHIYGLPAASNFYDMAMSLRADHIRYVGVGVMLLGGAWTLVTLIKPIAVSFSVSVKAFREAKQNQENFRLSRTERDIPLYLVGLAAVLLSCAAFLMFVHFFSLENHPFSKTLTYGISLFAVLYLLIFGALLASVCAYIVGLLGVTNNPLSGLILGSVLITSLILLPFFSHMIPSHPGMAKIAVSIVIIITTVVALATIISGENIQDLKAGQMVGATPWKQQVMLLVGVAVAALVVGPALELLFKAYGIGGVVPRAGMDPSQILSAPQAGLVAAVAQGVFGHSLAWTDISIGILIALAAIIVDEILKKKGRRLPVLAIGIGIYLPPEITSSIIIGGALNCFCKFALKRKGPSLQGFENGTMLACGLVAGAALMGVLLAIPFVLKGSSNALRIAPQNFTIIAYILGFLSIVFLCTWLYKTTVKQK
ncbi:MAG: oligopeptide transporter, OPT family [Proteobacteria bacterium]|nr:oligopeptide transporter, OPT family [Pseudomonadota bacterium]